MVVSKDRYRLAFIGLLFLCFGVVLWSNFRDSKSLEPFRMPPLFKQSYSVVYSSEGAGTMVFPSGTHTSQSSAPSLEHKVKIRLEGRWTIFLKNQVRDDFLFSFRFTPSSNPDLQSESWIKPIEGSFAMSKWGEIQSFDLPSDQYEESVIILADIFNMLNLDLKNGSHRQWAGTEKSFVGPTSVEWSIQDQNKTDFSVKKHYLNKNVSLQQAQGSVLVNADLNSYLISVDGERERQYFQAGQVVSRDVTKIAIKRIPADDPTAISLPPDMVKESLEGRMYRQKMSESMAIRTLNGSSQDELIALLSDIDSTDLKASKDLYLKIKAQIQLHPEAGRAFKPFLMKYAYEDLRCSHVATALTTVGDQSSQRILMEAIKDSDGDAHKRERLVPHLSFAESPTTETERFLKELSDNDPDSHVRGTARLAQGTVAHQLLQSSPERSSIILRDWEQKLKSASDEKGRNTALRVIGNIGMVEQVETVLPFVSDADADVRVQAANALRLVNSPEALSALTRLLKVDPEVKVRESAAQSLGYSQSSPELLELYEDLLFQDHNVTILSNVIHNLGNIAKTDPTALKLLKKFSTKCGKTELCQQADSVLSTLGR